MADLAFRYPPPIPYTKKYQGRTISQRLPTALELREITSGHGWTILQEQMQSMAGVANHGE